MEDLGSKNGTFHKERRIERPAALSDGDEIRLGSLRFEIPPLRRAASTETATPLK